jgi:hypothetical protein
LLCVCAITGPAAIAAPMTRPMRVSFDFAFMANSLD